MAGGPGKVGRQGRKGERGRVSTLIEFGVAAIA